MYLDKQGKEVPCPDEIAGLYIQARSGHIYRVSGLPPDSIAFQIGETSQIQSGGLLQATPHAVRGPLPGSNVTRETMALFLEPEFPEVLDIPSGKTIDDCQAPQVQLPHGVIPLSQRWKPGITFGDFHIATVTAFTTTDK
jgi:hypothetical protein